MSDQTLEELINARVEAALQAHAETQAAATPDPPGPDVNIPQVPHVDHVPTSDDEVKALSGMLANFRKEIAGLRQELRQRSGHNAVFAGPTETVEERTNRRLEQIAQHSHYCPGCGELYNYAQQCSGPAGGQQHPPLEVVSTEELGGDPESFTKAPATDPNQLPVLA